jgi:hypothetical protein
MRVANDETHGFARFVLRVGDIAPGERDVA